MPVGPGPTHTPFNNDPVNITFSGPSTSPADRQAQFQLPLNTDTIQDPTELDLASSEVQATAHREEYTDIEEEGSTPRGDSGGVLIGHEEEGNAQSSQAGQDRHSIVTTDIDGTEMASDNRSTSGSRPRDIFSPQNRISRASTPHAGSITSLLQLLTDEDRELLLSPDQETRSNISREEGDGPSIDSIMEDQLSSQHSTAPATPQAGPSSAQQLAESDSDNLLIPLDVYDPIANAEFWNAAASITSSDTNPTEEADSTEATEDDDTGQQESLGLPRPPFDFFRLPLFPSFLTNAGLVRPVGAHFITPAEYFDEAIIENFEENITDIEMDNPDFARLCRRLYDYHHFNPTTWRLTSLATQIKTIKRPDEVSREDMEKNGGDYQGIPWDSLGITRARFRDLRNERYKNYRNVAQVDYPKPDPLPTNRQFFRFNRQENEKKARVVHFQLRNLLSVTSRNDIFYSSEHCRIRRTGVGSKKSEVIIDLSAGVGGGSGAGTGSPVKITTMTTRHGVCIAGGFSGEYAMKSLYAPFESKPITGTVTLNENGITNHVHAHLGRNSGLPVAVFSSNDNKLRILDCYRNTFIGEQSYHWPINCSATSPDGRLRVVVGDHKDVMIVDADTGNTLRTLEGHQDFGFSCAWSDDGYTIATGNQDQTVRIYDARNFSRSIAQIGTTIAGVRTLRFSENGCGRRVLVCPEPADYVHVIDAVTWDGMQSFEFFGEIAGAEFSPKGTEMIVANADMYVGGLMEFERWRDDKWDIWEGEDGLRSMAVTADVNTEDDDSEDEGEENKSRRRSTTGRISSSSTPIRQQRRRNQAMSPSTPSSPYNRLPASANLSSQRLRGSASTPPRARIQNPSIDQSMGSPSPSRIRPPPSPSSLQPNAIVSNFWDSSDVTFPAPSPYRVHSRLRRMFADSRRRWGVIQDFELDSDDEEEAEGPPDVDMVVDTPRVITQNEIGDEEMSEEEFSRWRAERIGEAVQREKDEWGSRRRKRNGTNMNDLFV